MIYLARLHVMAQGRTYRDSCGIARALDLIGERWALLVARELLLGPKRFTDLREGLPNLSPDVLAVALKAMCDPVPAGDTGARYQLCLDDQPFALQVTDGRLEVARGLATDPDATIETDSGTLASLLWHGQRLEEALEGGTVTLRGRRAAVRRFLRSFAQERHPVS